MTPNRIVPHAGRALAVVARSLAAAGTVGAQSREHRFALGAGIGITQSAGISGQAYHATAGYELPILRLLRVTAEALVQQGEVSGSPFSCDIFVADPCLGRTDRNRIAGVGIQAKPVHVLNRTVALHLVGGGGVYHRSTRSTEATIARGGET
ncbi:MAG: hypothetical protein H0X64_06530, partial [Gemmatimonadaceae bacterium]|nr:hypothetical protein [Gemmatimonadaceae bacterium]